VVLSGKLVCVCIFCFFSRYFWLFYRLTWFMDVTIKGILRCNKHRIERHRTYDKDTYL
jgi:hypothetical protein